MTDIESTLGPLVDEARKAHARWFHDTSKSYAQCEKEDADARAALMAEVERLIPKWRPMESAPVHAFVQADWFNGGPSVLLTNGSNVFIGFYGYTKRGKGRWRDTQGRVRYPTHWMPLPPPPGDQP